jgi:hypothetical protein
MHISFFNRHQSWNYTNYIFFSMNNVIFVTNCKPSFQPFLNLWINCFERTGINFTPIEVSTFQVFIPLVIELETCFVSAVQTDNYLGMVHKHTEPYSSNHILCCVMQQTDLKFDIGSYWPKSVLGKYFRQF